MIDTVYAISEDKFDSHFAIKYSSMMTIETMTRWSNAQKTYVNEILKSKNQTLIDINDLKNSLIQKNIDFTDLELKTLFDSLKFPDNKTEKLSQVEIYANGHLFKLNNPENELNYKIAINCGAIHTDMKHFSKFSERLYKLTNAANDRNC